MKETRIIRNEQKEDVTGWERPYEDMLQGTLRSLHFEAAYAEVGMYVGIRYMHRVELY